MDIGHGRNSGDDNKGKRAVAAAPALDGGCMDFILANTHFTFPHSEQEHEHRLHQARVLASTVDDFAREQGVGTTILTGDFNGDVNSRSCAHLIRLLPLQHDMFWEGERRRSVCFRFVALWDSQTCVCVCVCVSVCLCMCVTHTHTLSLTLYFVCVCAAKGISLSSTSFTTENSL